MRQRWSRCQLTGKSTMRKKLFAAFCLLLAATPFMNTFAADLSVGLSDHTAQVRFATTINERAVADGGWTHHEEKGDLLEAGFYGFSRVDQLDIKIGGRYFWVDLDGPDGQGITIGTSLAYNITKAMAVETDIFYAPSVTSYKDIDHFRHLYLGMRVTISDNSHVFLGYRDIEANIDDESDRTLHEGGFGGFRILF